MKIQQLTIHNIASIEDAQINFDKGPLASDPLFLICGETGAGKTTLLNAICLALYNTAPNLEAIGTADDDVEGVKTNNPRQLMRRGTVDAFVALTFEGNDSKHYEATWNVKRARGKINGSIQNVKRTLLCKETDVCLQKDLEIKQAIQEVVGLTFEQFCRTTMLAQGQFSLFMNSKEKDKADILEKLTGTEIYARIGKKVFDLCKAKTIEFDRLDSEIKGAELLSEDTKTEYKIKIEELNIKKADYLKVSNQLREKIEWLQTYQKLGNNLQETTTQYNKVCETIGNPEVKEQQTLLADWDATSTIRATYRQEQQADAQLDKYNGQLILKKQDLGDFIAGINFLKRKKEELLVQLHGLDVRIAKDSVHEEMYKAAGEINLHINTISNKQYGKRTYEAAVKKAQTDLDKQNTELATTEAELAEAVKTFLSQREVLEKLTEGLKGINVAMLTEKVTRLGERQSALDEAIRTLTTYYERLTELATVKKNQEGLLNDLKVQRELKQKHSLLLPQLQKEYEALENQFKGKQDLRDHLIELRQRFQQTHQCPLCGSDVDGLHTDEFLNEELTAMLQKVESAKKQQEETERSIHEAEATIRQGEKLLADTERDLAQKTKDLQYAAQQAQSCMAPFNIDLSDEQAMILLENLKGKAKKEKEHEYQHLLAANKQKEDVDKAGKLLESYRQNGEKIKNRRQDFLDKKKALQTIIETNKQLSALADKDEKEALSKIKQMVSLSVDWNSVVLSDLGRLINEQAATYQSNKDLSDKILAEIDHLTQEAESAQAHLNQLSQTFSLEANIAEVREKKDLLPSLRNFVAEVQQLSGSIASTKVQLARAQQEIKDYTLSHPEHSTDRIKYLLSLSAETITSYKTELNRLNERRISLAGEVRQLSTQIETHNTHKPELPENASIEGLSGDKEKADTELVSSNNELIMLQARLKNNEELIVRIADKCKKLEILRHERDNWQQLEAAFGGSDGGKFKKIAQSYVLRALLQKSNYFLQMLSNRYVLECNDGSLTINVIDNKQGGAVRSVGLLSGGEGFIVSLALALGLSTIGKEKINVDTLFIDEGFGTLSDDYLDVVINTLDRLHQLGGRKVGVISHVAKLSERIPTQIRLNRTGPSSSSIEVVSGT